MTCADSRCLLSRLEHGFLEAGESPADRGLLGREKPGAGRTPPPALYGQEAYREEYCSTILYF